MPTYDLDEESTLFEPLKIKVGGKELINERRQTCIKHKEKPLRTDRD